MTGIRTELYRRSRALELTVDSMCGFRGSLKDLPRIVLIEYSPRYIRSIEFVILKRLKVKKVQPLRIRSLKIVHVGCT